MTNCPENEQNSLAGLSESQASDQESLTEEANPQKDERSEEDGLRLSYDESSEGVEKGNERAICRKPCSIRRDKVTLHLSSQ